MKVLVRQRMRKFVHQRLFAHILRRPIGDVKLLLVVVVKRRRLFGQQVHFGFRQVEILRHKSELLQAQFLDPQVLLGRLLLHALLQEFVDLVFRNQIKRDLVANLQPGNLVQFL